jgi:hypothetical protein
MLEGPEGVDTETATYGPPVCEIHTAARSCLPDPTAPATTVLVRQPAADAA